MGALPNPPAQNPPAPPTANKLLQALPTLIYGVITVLILGVILWGLYEKGGGFLTNLSDMAVARGLITFLITFTTVGIAIILAVSTIFSASGDDEDKRFDKGKQVLGVLIGLLGTIVGFYFGSAREISAAQPTPKAQVVTIAPANVSNLQPKKGEKFTISSFVSGGKAPYTYSITFDSPLLPAIKEVQTSDGVIRQEFTVPDTLSADTQVKFQILVTDNEKKTADYNKDGAVSLSLKTK
jgi:hypothetical protein